MDNRQFEAIFYRMKDRLFRYALRFVIDRDTAEDVLQDVMTKLWQKREDADKIENIEAWLMVLTRNRSLDILRKNKENHVPVDEAISLSDKEPIADKLLENEDMMNILQQCLNQLPEKQRTVFHLREIEQMSYDEIAETTGFNLDDVKVSLFRARKHIQRMIGKTSPSGQFQL